MELSSSHQTKSQPLGNFFAMHQSREMEAPREQKGKMSVLMPFVRPHAKVIFWAMALNAFSGMAISVQTVTPKWLIDDILLNEKFEVRQKMLYALLLCAGFLVVTIVWRMLLWHLSYRILTRTRETVLRDLRSAFFRHLNSLCLRFHLRNQTGELFSYLFGTPLTKVQAYLNQLTMMGPHMLFSAIGTLGVVVFWDPLVTVVMFAMVATSSWVMHVTRVRARAISQAYQEREKKVSGRVADLLRGSRHIKIHGIEEDVSRHFDSEADAMSRQGVQHDIQSHMLVMRYETVGYIGFALLCLVGGWRYLQGAIQIGEFAAYLSAYAALSLPLNVLFQIVQARGAAQASFERIEEVFETISTTPEPSANAQRSLPERGDLAFENVSFSYEEKGTLFDINLVVPHGQKIALVGPSGAGKSTLVQLAMRLFDPDSGAVSIGGVDLRECSSREIRRRFGVVPQQPFLFRASVRENLSLLRRSASEEELWHALELARAADFVRELPGGLESMLGEEGATLSGGQRQRLAIARALLSKPEFFIFDEATSALDPVSEQLILSALRDILPGRTSIVIAHRFSTIRDCDRVLVMERGRIVQDGSYEELEARPGLFADLLRDGMSASQS